MFSGSRLVVLGLVLFAIGCGPGSTPVPPDTRPVTELIRQDLQGIVSSNQLGSEMVSIDKNLQKLAETEPDKAAELRQEYEKLQKSSGSPARQAKRMMEKL
ncbi:hypothetical protein Pan97_18710 [Bremerella volcania]|uniref:Uncharacterized protein n=1 Tax=Bremerella volcania TaxID=2527984 RepID=A0A518C6K3_9BACT|nr:hypothetical protein [Bremerella volcania]QDU74853.1 hypothetical protein Pan97_18710 [Bremerella volcania]